MGPAGQRRFTDSDQRQRAAITGFAKANHYEIVDEYYDVASGADPIDQRPGFKAMLERIAGNGVRVILIESPDRFARDLTVQILGHRYLQSLNVELIPVSAPDHFTQDTPTAVLVQQMLGAISSLRRPPGGQAQGGARSQEGCDRQVRGL